jgi:hypothetical protein
LNDIEEQFEAFSECVDYKRVKSCQREPPIGMKFGQLQWLVAIHLLH